MSSPPTADELSDDGRISLASDSDRKPAARTESPPLASKRLKILPNGTAKPGTAPKIQIFTYLVKLDFTKFPTNAHTGKPTANVAQLLQRWIQNTRILSPGSFQLLPYDEGPNGNKGQPITHEDQLPTNDEAAYNLYYHNHRLLRNNNHLTGMIRFSLSIPWHFVKDPKKPYFHWLRSEGIYMSRHNFQMDNVSAAGWFFGVHPDITRRDDSHNELIRRINLPIDINFQLSSRTLNIPLVKNGDIKIQLRAIVVECDHQHVNQVREAMFHLGDPKTARLTWPITGYFMFVPLFETKAWPHRKIVAVTKRHTLVIDRLKPLYLENIKDIDDRLEDEQGNSLTVRAGLLQFEVTKTDGAMAPLFHSVHKTNKDNVITLLTDKDWIPAAEQKLLGIHDELTRSLPASTHNRVLFADRQVQITGRIVDSASSRSYASLFDDIIDGNPQDDDPPPPPAKAPRMELSYSQATSATGPTTTTEKETVSDMTESDLDTLLSRMKTKFGDFLPLKSDEVDARIQAQTTQILQNIDSKFEKRFHRLETSLSTKFDSIAGKLDTLPHLEERMDHRNTLFKRTVNDLVEHNYSALASFVAQMQSNLTIVQQNMASLAPPNSLRPLVPLTLDPDVAAPRTNLPDSADTSDEELYD